MGVLSPPTNSHRAVTDALFLLGLLVASVLVSLLHNLGHKGTWQRANTGPLKDLGILT